ncbi:methylamine utilization protein [Sphingobium boeckii]|uniref:Plastocyanin n=1 Tax=Sphingobium boeckii TaxID=1082345 RepID=A0A7W9AIR1_9SPHN|nr:methylamine utilization protein [Sphingobium boeckii]MBB5686380.1 plastocyanin [Sphingobium boeckii]
MRLLAIICAGILPGTLGATTLSVTVNGADGKPLRNAVVSVQSPATRVGTASVFTDAPSITQQNIQFAPDVLLVRKGTTVSFPNRDKVRHHVYSFSKPKRFELKLYGKDDTHSVRFEIAGTIALGCNIHDQMSAFIRVVDTPWAGKTDANGRVTISGIPGGSSTITVWHPKAVAKNGEFVAPLPLPASGSIAKLITMRVAPR